MQYIGTTEEALEYLHPDGKKYTGKFEFYWDRSTGAIDVCHLGCNGAIFIGRVNKVGRVVFYSLPPGYPDVAVFEQAFKKLQKDFLSKK